MALRHHLPRFGVFLGELKMTFTQSNLAELSNLLDTVDSTTNATTTTTTTAGGEKVLWAPGGGIRMTEPCISMAALKGHFGARMCPSSSLGDAAGKFAAGDKSADLEAHALRLRVMTAQSGGASKEASAQVADAMATAAMAKGRAKSQIIALSDILAKSEKLSLKGRSDNAAISVMESLDKKIRACFTAPKAAKRAKPADYKGAYAALAAHCAANGISVPATKGFGF
jgi:hypothetical protein